MDHWCHSHPGGKRISSSSRGFQVATEYTDAGECVEAEAVEAEDIDKTTASRNVVSLGMVRPLVRRVEGLILNARTKCSKGGSQDVCV